MQKRILVVDDDAMNLRRTSLILEKHYEVLLVKSGEEALDKLKHESIDLILLDIAMPGMNGIQTFKRLKEDDVMTAIRLGAANYLKKPFMPKELLERVAKEFEKK